MKKNIWYKSIWFFACLLIIVFLGRTLFDYINYDDYNSAPFSAFVLLNCLLYLLPSLLLFLISYLLKKYY